MTLCHASLKYSIDMLIKDINENYMRYTTTSQEIFETFCISKAHKKHLKIDEEKKMIYFNYPIKDVEINYEPRDHPFQSSKNR